MPPLPQHEILFESVQVGPKCLPNRFYQVPHCGTGDLRPGTQAMFRAMRASGGWGAVCVESASISPETDVWPLHLARIWDDNDVRNLACATDAIHSHGSLAGIELWWGGANTTALETRVPGRAPSQIAAAPGSAGHVPQAMLLSDIREVRQLFVAAAERSRSAGFDIVYVYGGHSQGPMQFLSPTWNRRTDEYGGSFENRARFWIECLSDVRQAVGDECAITSRISVQDFGWGGVGPDEALRFIDLADDLVDFWDVNVASLDWSTDIGSSRFFEQNSQREWTSPVRGHTKKPIVCVGRFTDPDLMAAAVRSGQCDIIGAARPSIADPFLPAKIARGDIDEICECIGCNFCLSRWAQGGAPVACTQNPTAGEEYRRGWHPERVPSAANRDRSVLIVGAGPAGLECARILGQRGMEAIHLVEASDEVGGALSWMTTLPRLSEWRRVIDYRRSRIDRLSNVSIVNRKRLTRDDIVDYGADIVIVATGSHWSADGLSGATQAPIPGAVPDAAHVLTPEQLVVSGKDAGDRVIVYDCEGWVVGIGSAELLARTGSHVTLVTPMETPGEFARFTGEVPHVRRALIDAGISVLTETVIDSIQPGVIETRDLYDTRQATINCSSIVLVTQRVSDDQLYRELITDPDLLATAGVEAVYRIGDCVSPRTVADAVFDGHRLAREIDSPHPDRPLPFIREIRLVGSSDDHDYATQLGWRIPDPSLLPAAASDRGGESRPDWTELDLT